MESYSPTTKGVDLYVNGQFIGFLRTRNKRVIFKFIQKYLPTHMREIYKTKNGWRYDTTIGKTIHIEKCKRLTELLCEYELEIM